MVEVVVVVVEVVDIVVVVEILMVVDDVREDSAECVVDDRTYLGTGIDVVMEVSSSPMSGISVTEPEEDVVVNQFDHHESSVVVSSMGSSTDTTSRSDIMSDGLDEPRSSNDTGQDSLSSALLSLMRKPSCSRLGSMMGSIGSLENIMSSLVFAPYSSPISGAIVVSPE